MLPGEPAETAAAYRDAGVAVFIHSPYTVNVASPNNRIRIPSRKILSQQLEAAASIGAQGLIVHGGHVTAGTDPAEGYDSWRKAVERVDRPLPMLIENTAGGDGAMARSLDGIARLWEAVTDAAGDDGNVGFCLDTCHAHAAGLDLATVVDRIKAITGRIDLVHGNNSRDEFGSGRDRHAGLESGTIDPELILGVIRAAGAPVICETPDPEADVAWLARHLAQLTRTASGPGLVSVTSRARCVRHENRLRRECGHRGRPPGHRRGAAAGAATAGGRGAAAELAERAARVRGRRRRGPVGVGLGLTAGCRSRTSRTGWGSAPGPGRWAAGTGRRPGHGPCASCASCPASSRPAPTWSRGRPPGPGTARPAG